MVQYYENTRLGFLKIFLLLIAFTSCTGEYDEEMANVLQHKDNEKSIAISGRITSDYKQQTIFISRSMDFSELFLSSESDSKKRQELIKNRSVRGAKVSVEVAGKKYEFKEAKRIGYINYMDYNQPEPTYISIPYDEIYYESVDSFAGIPNQEHKLVVEVEGKTYTAMDVMPQVSEISFTEKSPLCRIVEILGDEDHKVKLIHTGFPNYLFGQKEAYIMGFNPIQTYTVEQGNYDKEFTRFGDGPCFSFRQLAAPQLMGEVIGCVQVCPSIGSYHDNHLTDTIVVTKMSCSSAYEYFLYCLFQNKYGNDFDFGDISSNVPTNISNGGVGFFATCDVRRQIFSKRNLVQLAESIGNIIE